MSFKIEITNTPIPKIAPPEKAVYGEITINNFRERFHCSIEYWSRDDYHRQWVDAIERLLGESERATSALVSDMHDPSSANFITCWPLYKEGDKVYIHNNLLFLDELPRPFLVDDIDSYIGPRERSSEDGGPISEWVASASELKKFLAELKELS